MAKKSIAPISTVSPVVKFAKLMLDGREYRLAYSLRGLAEAEAASGLDLLGTTLCETEKGADDKIRIVRVEAGQLFWRFYAALRKHHPEITVDAADDLVTHGNQYGIFTALTEAYAFTMQRPNPPVAGKHAATPAKN